MLRYPNDAKQCNIKRNHNFNNNAVAILVQEQEPRHRTMYSGASSSCAGGRPSDSHCTRFTPNWTALHDMNYSGLNPDAPAFHYAPVWVLSGNAWVQEHTPPPCVIPPRQNASAQAPIGRAAKPTRVKGDCVPTLKTPRVSGIEHRKETQPFHFIPEPLRCARDLSRVLITKSGLADLHLRYNAALFGDGPREECDLLHEEMMQVRSQRKASKEKTMTKQEKSMRNFALALHEGIIQKRVPLVQVHPYDVAVHASAQPGDAPDHGPVWKFI
jgi:hypothetical protein